MYCSNCKLPLKVGLACSTCKDFKLCTRCYGRVGHLHDMKQVILMLSTDLFPKNNRMNGYASQVPQHPVNTFVQNLSQTYQKHRSNSRGVCQFIFDHFSDTNLVCNCVFCKKMFLMYKFHCIKCQVSLCSLENCTIINDQIFKRPFPTMSDEFVMQKLMKIRLIMKRAQNTTSRAAPNETTHPIARNPALLRKFTIQRCIRTLVHACQCVEANCMPASCQKMKRILSHIKVCKRKVAGGCIVCKQLCTLCCYHAKSCHESRCSVLLCSYIKRKLRESKIKKTLPRLIREM